MCRELECGIRSSGDSFRASSRLWQEAVLTPPEPPPAAITEAACADMLQLAVLGL